MEAIGNLAGGIAHNFNNMLTVILGYSHLILSSGAVDSRIRGQVEAIAGAAERSVGLTRHLLTFSRNQILQPKVLNLNAVVRQTEKMLRPLIGENITLVNRPGENLGKIKADPGQIEQVIMNLAVNARDAMPDGGTLSIETKNVEFDEDYVRWHPGARAGAYAMLKVTDTGCGMDQQTISHIFEPFFTTKEAGKGTGLGLATVYGIVKQSGGAIWVYSEVGQGTTFKMYLPLAEESAEPAESGEMRVDVRNGGETILLVEDEAVLRQLIHDMLERYGYAVVEAGSAEEAILLCEQRQGRISLLLTDVTMTGMNGSQLADRLRIPHPEMKVLYMSGYTDGSIVRHGVLRHGTRLIEKPFKAETLNKKLREILGAEA
jgi:CheY-like chemotaxis protein